MAETTGTPLELILQLCNSAAPSPWYPSVHARETGITRASLDPHLDRLRLAGLVKLTDWMPGTGQGYVLTPAGKDLLSNPRAMDLLRAGKLSFEVKPEPAEPLLEDAVTKRFARGDAVLDVFTRRVPARMTYLLIAANLLVFGYGYQLSQKAGLTGAEYLGTGDLFGGHRLDPRLADVFVAEGALTPQSLVQGQWWRLITSCFVHLGFIHLAGNMIMLYFIGTLTERMWGPGWYLILYLLSGFAGACAMARFGGPNSVGAGASGALWGLMTSLVAWILLNRAHMPPPMVSTMLRRILNLVVLNVLLSFAPGVSAAAHFGGGAAGIVVSVLIHGCLYGQRSIKILSGLGAILFPFACFGALFVALRSTPQFEAYDFIVRVRPQMLAAEKEANDIRDQNFKRRLGALSEQELRQAIQAQKQIIDALRKGVDAGKRVSAYRNSKLEEERQKDIGILEQRIAEVERRNWQENVSPAVHDEIRLASRFFYEQTKPLLGRPPATREKEALEKTETGLHEQIARLSRMRDLLDSLGPQETDARLEESRKEQMDNLSFIIDLFTRAAAGLKEGSQWPESERKHLDDLMEQFRFR
jgi:rhomboid protease GluP